MEEFDVNKNIIIAIITIVLAFAGGYTLSNQTNKDSKTLQGYHSALGQCKSQCAVEGKIGYLREEEQNHLKCFCWSDMNRTMEYSSFNNESDKICFQRE